MPTNMNFTKEKVKKLKKRYKQAVKDKEEVFMFEGYELVTNYAKFLIEYLELVQK